MIITCPECGNKFVIDDKYSKKNAMRMRCGHCMSIFLWQMPVISARNKLTNGHHQDEHPFFQLRGFFSYPRINIAGHWSYPAFIKSSNQHVFWLHLILSMVPYHDKRITGLFRPRASVITTPASKTIVCIQDYYSGICQDPFNNYEWNSQVAGIYPHDKIRGISARELKAKESILLSDCEMESDRFKAEGVLSKSFCRQWIELSHPVFAGFLNEVASDFIKAIELGIG